MKHSLIIITILISILHFPDELHAQRKYIIKFATLAPEGTTWMNILSELNEEINTRTNNQMRFKFYQGMALDDDLDVVRKMRSGQIHCAGLTGKGMGDILPASRVLELPFLFDNEEEKDYVINKLFTTFEIMFKEKGFILLGWAEVGFVYIFSNKPITSLEDMKGVRMWMWEKDRLAEEIYHVYGINPTALTPSEVMDSLQNNRIDAFYNSPLAAIATGWFTGIKYMTEVPIANAAGVVVILKKYFDRLPPELQNILKESCSRFLRKLVLESRKDNKSSIEVLKKNGIKIIHIEDAEKINFLKSLSFKVQRNLINKLYSQELLERVLNTVEEFRNSRR